MDLEKEKEKLKIQLHSNRYFMENLHVMYNKKTIIFLNNKEGSALHMALYNKYIKQEEIKKNDPNSHVMDDALFEEKMNYLKCFFLNIRIPGDKTKECFNGIVVGGGGLAQLKETIRKKIKQIVPR